MKNPLESLHATMGLGVALTAIMVLIVAIFYWDTGEPTAPATSEQPAATEQPASTEGQPDATGGDAGTTTGTETSN